MLALFKNKPYDFPPGTRWNYSNSGYYLLGLIVEKASGKKFSDYLQQEVINRAGLKNTSMDRLDSVLAFRAKDYAKNSTALRPGHVHFHGRALQRRLHVLDT
jgi:CubicO group peptidase (beta-lactamase class C family)